MDYKNNSNVQNIINIFNKNFEIVDIYRVRGAYDSLVKKDKKGENNLSNIVDDIFDDDDNDEDKMTSEPSTKEASQKNSSSNPFSNNEQFGSSDQNEKSNCFKHSSQDYLKQKYSEIAEEIFEIISPLSDEHKIRNILTEVKNHFNKN
jgi:hypothetical protein